MSKRKILVIDTETGGTDPQQHAILSIGLAVLHEGSIDGEYYSEVLEERINERYDELVTPEAAAVNGYTKLKIIGNCLKYAYKPRVPMYIVDEIIQFLLKHDMREPRKVTLGGIQTDFDAKFLRRLWTLAGLDNYDKVFDRRVLDVSHGALLLEQAGRIDLRGDAPSLDNVARAIGVRVDRNDTHNALEDVRIVSKVIKRMTDLLRHTDWPVKPVEAA